MLRKVFSEAERDLSDYLDLVALDPQWRCFFDDGSTLDLVADTTTMADRVAGYTADPSMGDGYRRFMRASSRLHDVSERFFFWRSVGSLRDTFQLGNTFRLSTLGDLWSLRMGRSVAGTVRRCVPEKRVAQMLDHFTQYVGSAPDMSPAVLCGIAHMQTGEAVWYPKGGTAAVPRALSRLAKDLGAELRPDVFVRRILVEDGAVRGVETQSGETIPLSAVVSNCDSVRTHRKPGTEGSGPRRVIIGNANINNSDEGLSQTG